MSVWIYQFDGWHGVNIPNKLSSQDEEIMIDTKIIPKTCSQQLSFWHLWSYMGWINKTTKWRCMKMKETNPTSHFPYETNGRVRALEKKPNVFFCFNLRDLKNGLGKPLRIRYSNWLRSNHNMIHEKIEENLGPIIFKEEHIHTHIHTHKYMIPIKTFRNTEILLRLQNN